jgi:hypothetical protein
MDVLLNARREMRSIFSRSDPEMQRARWITAFTLCLANISGAAITFAIGVLAFPSGVVTDRGLFILGGAAGGYLALTLVLGSVTALRIAAAAEAVLTSEEEVPPAQLQQVLRNQWRQTQYTALYWLGGRPLSECCSRRCSRSSLSSCFAACSPCSSAG